MRRRRRGVAIAALLVLAAALTTVAVAYATPNRAAAPNVRASGDATLAKCGKTRTIGIAAPLTGDAASLAQFDAFFARPDVQRVPLSTAVYDRATLLRATYNSKLGDSLHLAAAIEAGCDLLLTNDHRLSKCTEIRIEVLP